MSALCMVTGCAGFIGSHLAESLLEDGCEVLGIDCFNSNYARPQKLRNLERARDWEAFDFVPLDLARGSLADLVAEVDVVFHLAAEPGVRGSWGGRFGAYVRNNVVATQHLLEAMRREPGRRFVYSSSSSVYGQAARLPAREDGLPAPHSLYGVTKLSGEHLCRTYHENFGVDTVTLRYFSVYGPRQRPDMAFDIFMRAALRGEPIRLLGADRSRDFTYVADVVRATRLAAERPALGGATVNVGSGTPVSLRAAVEQLAETAGLPLEVVEGAAEPGEVRDTAADLTRARALLGYEPEVDLAEGLRAQWEWLAAEEGALT